MASSSLVASTVASHTALLASLNTSKVDSGGGLGFFTDTGSIGRDLRRFNVGPPRAGRPVLPSSKAPAFCRTRGGTLSGGRGRVRREWKRQPCTHTQNAVAVVVFPGRCCCTMVGAARRNSSRSRERVAWLTAHMRARLDYDDAG
jgi:hypothetical protein